MSENLDKPWHSRSVRIFIWAAVVGAFWDLACGVASTVAHHLSPLQPTAFIEGLVKLLDRLGYSPFLHDRLLQISQWPPFVAGFLIGTIGIVPEAAILYSLATWLHDYLFATPDHKVILPFPSRVLPYDPLWGSGLGPDFNKEAPLPWVPPSESNPRHGTWQTLIGFANQGASNGRFHFWTRRPRDLDFRPFRWAILTGRSGSGKTRMAFEFLHNELARPRRFEGLNWLERTKTTCGEWLRLRIPWTTRRPDDPWDIGWVRPESGDNQRKHLTRQPIDDDYLDELSRWRPRKPTALLLDDPLRGDERVLERLRGKAKHFRFPVRLLIVNQSLPDGSLFEGQNTVGPWSPRDATFAAHINLDEQMRLTKSEVIRVANTLIPEHKLREGNQDVEQRFERLMQMTDGNPLLVELALRVLIKGGSIDHLDADKLIRDRAERIIEALTIAHGSLPPIKELRALAASTMAGPGEFPSARNAGAAREMQFELDSHENALRHCFSLFNSASSPSYRPCVRPERIGDVFIRLVLEKTPDEKIQNEIAAFAWSLNPGGVLRTITRTAAHTDALGRILRIGPPSWVTKRKSVEPTSLILAYATAASHHSFDQPWPADSGNGVVEVTRQRILLLTPEHATTILPDLHALQNIQRDFLYLRKAQCAACFFSAIAHILEGNQFPMSEGPAIEILKMAVSVTDVCSEDYRVSLEMKLLPFIESALVALANKADSTPGRRSIEFEEYRAAIWRAVCRIKPLWDLAGCIDTAKRVCAIAQRLPGVPLIELSCATAWRHTFGAEGDPAIGDKFTPMQQDVWDILNRFPGQRLFELERANSWRYICYDRAIKGFILEAEVAARNVAALAEEFSGLDFFLQTVESWRYIAHAYAAARNLAGCIAAIKNIEEFARSFRGEYRFELNCLLGWKDLCWASAHAGSQHIAECESAIRKVDQIVAPFRGVAIFEFNRADGWRQICLAYAKAGDVAKCEEAVRVVEGIAEQFRGEADFELLFARAKRHLCYCYAHTRNIEKSKETAEAIDAISKQQQRAIGFELELALAWTNVCGALANARRTRECEEAAQKVHQIAQSFLGKEGQEPFLEECAEADRLVDWVRGQAPVNQWNSVPTTYLYSGTRWR